MEKVNENDVLCGRGGATNNHVGNRNFRKLVGEHQHAYLMARKRDKREIAQRIVSIVRNNGGRFLKRDENSSEEWVDVGDKRACEKTSQALREGLEVRRNGQFEKTPAILKDKQAKEAKNLESKGTHAMLTTKKTNEFSPDNPDQLPSSKLNNANTIEDPSSANSSIAPHEESLKKSDVSKDSKDIVAELESKGAAVVPV